MCVIHPSLLELLEHVQHVGVHVFIVFHGFFNKLPHDLWPHVFQDLHFFVAELSRLKKVSGEEPGSGYSVLLCRTRRL